jgi:hypothetical protein
VFYFFFFIPGTMLFLASAFLCVTYLSMGISQISTGGSEKNYQKRNGGITAVIFSIIGLALAAWLYWKFVWIW